MDKFKNKYRIKSARAEWWDYGNNGAYFVTICTEGQQHYFGSIEVGSMRLNSAGMIAQDVWNAIPNQFDWVRLADFVVMPNHVHGIVIIDKLDGTEKTETVGTTHDTTHTPGGFAGNKNPMLNNDLARIIRWYKGRCTYEIRKINPPFAWQTRYHDHIIRNGESFDRIADYIRTNPLNWENG